MKDLVTPQEVAKAALGTDWLDTESAARRVAEHAATALTLANARIVRLEEALKDYAETFCEFGDDHAGCGKFDAMTCSGCAARAATKRGSDRYAARIETLEDMVFSAYQFAGAVLDYAGLFEHPEGIRALDYFSSDGEEELLPWPNCDLSSTAILKGDA